ncbi:MAG: diguanylate cyclase [Actinomycetota bacterium]|nr:diguanylate cyclase [Actinomycetota bacterium]
MSSFKVRLVAYFLLLALLPLLGALWAFSEVAARGEVGRADARLNADLRVTVADFTRRVQDAEQRAASLARATGFHQALAAKNRGALSRLYREVPNAAFFSAGQLAAGTPPPALAVRRSARVVDQNGDTLGRVVVSVPLDSALVEDLGSNPGLDADDELALVSGGRVVVGETGLAETRLPVERPGDIRIGNETFRALATRLAAGPAETTLVALTPKSAIDAQAEQLRRRILLLAAMALFAAAILTYGLGRMIVRSLKALSEAAGAIARGNFSSRVPVRGGDEFASLGRAFNHMASELEARIEELAAERTKRRDAVARFGETLSATHDPYVLLPVILESMVEATGAVGGTLVSEGEELARAGHPEAGGEPLKIPLGNDDQADNVLVLVPPDEGFGEDATHLVHWLTSQARTALENASLHRRLELEAVTDGLTELPNRRQFEESLATELTRVERLGGSLAIILADLDDFKQVNDRYGHLAGDDVIRAFADVLQDNVRGIDTAARYGGEEFAVLLPETTAEGAERVAERIRGAMAERAIETYPGAVVTVTASLGVAAYPGEPTQEALVAAADAALYRAKAAGKNTVVGAEAAAVRRTA